MKLPANQMWLSNKPEICNYIRFLPRPTARILDVGCGRGDVVENLRNIGYKATQGVDPFITGDVMRNGKLLVRKAYLDEVTGRFECISFNHSLEHMPDQRAVFDNIRRLLAPNGIALIRIPVVGGEAWRVYRENWIQLDAPRHFYLHSRRSLELLARGSGMKIRSSFCDSTAFQFWGSELYSQDIPLTSTATDSRFSEKELLASSLFSEKKLNEYRRRASELNKMDDGDQIVAVLEALPRPVGGSRC